MSGAVSPCLAENGRNTMKIINFVLQTQEFASRQNEITVFTLSFHRNITPRPYEYNNK